MVFSSTTFLFFFLPVTLLLYFIVPFKLKNFILLLTSLVFYAWGEPVYIILMLYSILMNYCMGLFLGRLNAYRADLTSRIPADSPKIARLLKQIGSRRKGILAFTVILNLFLIGFFKYYGFLIENINALFGLKLKIRTLALPIGISFYTFQALSYVIDLYRGKFPAQKNIVKFAAYITMFPQLIAGPIVRYEDVEKQLTTRRITLSKFGEGTVRFIFGLAKKVLLANLSGALFDTVRAAGADVSTLTAWLGALAYTFQIYFDFSGYSDMAIGLGKMLGFDFIENFNYPYYAKNVTDFWRRWHISLSTWFREYVYIPLGGNRVSVLKHIRNILIVWALTGLWHGASWNFVLWGLYYGILLLLEKYIFMKIKIPAFITRIFTAVLVIFGWVIFSAETIPEIRMTVLSMCGKAANGLTDNTAFYLLRTNAVLFAADFAFSFPWVRNLYKFLSRRETGRLLLFLFLLLLLGICTAFLVTQNYNPFLYFRF